MLDPTVTLNFDLLTPEPKAFIFVPNRTETESLAKKSNTFQDIVLTMFWTDGCTNSLKHYASAALCWRRHKKKVKKKLQVPEILLTPNKLQEATSIVTSWLSSKPITIHVL